MAGLKVSADRVLESAGVLEVQPLQTDTNLATLQMYRLSALAKHTQVQNKLQPQQQKLSNPWFTAATL